MKVGAVKAPTIQRSQSMQRLHPLASPGPNVPGGTGVRSRRMSRTSKKSQQILRGMQIARAQKNTSKFARGIYAHPAERILGVGVFDGLRERRANGQCVPS
jgi:hypothetical protein